MQIKGTQKMDVFVSLVQRWAELAQTEGKTLFQQEQLVMMRERIEKLK